MGVRDFLLECRSERRKDQMLTLSDETLRNVFSHSLNREFIKVFPMVIVLNKLYRINVYNEMKLVNHILTISRDQNFDSLLLSGRVEAVKLIRQGHGIVTKKGKEINYYSFATKFCHWCNPFDYPIYDSFIDTAIRFLIGVNVPVPDFADWTNLKDYATFKKVIDYLKQELDFSDFSYKDFDEALWMYGKFLEKRLPPPVQSRLLEVLKKP